MVQIPSQPELHFKLLSDADLKRPSPAEEIADLLESAAGILRRHPNGERDDSVAWRVADAGLLLRALMAKPKRGWSNEPGVQGINCPTGMGAMLPPKAGA